MFLLFLIFLVSEGLLFVSFFWTSFHSLSSLTLGISLGEGFYLVKLFGEQVYDNEEEDKHIEDVEERYEGKVKGGTNLNRGKVHPAPV